MHSYFLILYIIHLLLMQVLLLYMDYNILSLFLCAVISFYLFTCITCILVFSIIISSLALQLALALYACNLVFISHF